MNTMIPTEGPDQFPLQQLKNLHFQLGEFETFLQLTGGGWSNVRKEIERIYKVQELIEKIINEEKNGI